MSQERKQILDMLAAGKINADEAERLLDALAQSSEAGGENRVNEENEPKSKIPKYLFVQIDPDPVNGNKKERVNIKIPLALIRAGIKLSSLIPEKGKINIKEKLAAKGIDIDIDKLDGESLDEILVALSDMSIDVEDGGEKIRIYCR